MRGNESKVSITEAVMIKLNQRVPELIEAWPAMLGCKKLVEEWHTEEILSVRLWNNGLRHIHEP